MSFRYRNSSPETTVAIQTASGKSFWSPVHIATKTACKVEPLSSKSTWAAESCSRLDSHLRTGTSAISTTNLTN